MNSLVDDFEFPSFSLGLEAPSFSLGLDDSQPPSPCFTRLGSERAQDDQQAAGPLAEASDSEDMPRRPLKRLRHGSRKKPADAPPVPSSSGPVFGNDPVDDIEEFSSADDDEKLQSRSRFSPLKPVPTPPVFEKRGPAPSPVSVKRTSLGSKEVKFQDFQDCGSLQGSRSEKLRTPLYDERICIDIDEDNNETPSVTDSPGRSDQIAALLRERLPHFSFIDDLEDGGEPVYIDYRGQFGSKPAAGKDTAKAPKAKAGGKARSVRVKAKSRAATSQNPQQGATAGRKGHWLTEFGTKVYVAADGQRLSGQNAYKRYMKDNGKLPRRSQKQKKQRGQKRSQR